MGRFDFRSPQRKGYEIHRKKRAFPAVFIDIGPDGVRIAEWLKTDGGMSIAHKADGDESEAFRGVEIFESVFYLHDCGTRAAIKKIVVSPTGCAVSPCVARSKCFRGGNFHYARDARSKMEISKVKSFLVLVGAA